MTFLCQLSSTDMRVFAAVNPIFKQSDRSDMNDYRPITVISAMAKVFARIVYNPKISIWFSIPSLNCDRFTGSH